MKNAIAIWNYCWNADALPGWIDEFADHGFEVISFHPGQFAGERVGCLPEVVEVLRGRGLVASVHGKVSMDRGAMGELVEGLGDRLVAFTMDSVMRHDSRGSLHDAGRIAGALGHLQDLTRGSDVWLAVEDFPLDGAALEVFAGDLGGVYEHGRTGILVDVGHMHLRRSAGESLGGMGEYFSGMSVSEYFRRLPVPLVEVHLHDNNGKKDEHGHLGFGGVPFAEVAAALKEMAFDGLCTIEIAPTFHDRTPEESKPDAMRSLDCWRGLM